MSNLRKIRPNHILIYIISIFFLIVILPVCCIKLFPSIVENYTHIDEVSVPDYVDVYITNKGNTEKIPFETYIQGVVASEMPKTFETEALKAQAIASRTYALGRIEAGTQLCDTVHCQVYRSNDISEAVKTAVNATKGELMYSKGKLASHALYFASSGGRTENSQDVFSGSFSYLKSVGSSYEPGATHKSETTTMKIKAFSKKIKEAYPSKKFGIIKKSNIRIKSLSEGGRVKKIKIGNRILTGTELRSALGLYSARIKISFDENKIIITTSGSGHGVGMSQYGANGMAKNGYDYKSILTHYYSGTIVQ